MKLTLNKEYALRHLFVTLLMAGLGGWFGYDGFVRYPATPAAELYRSIEGSDAPAGFDLEAFKAQKTKTQYGFAILSLFAALVVGSRLYRSYAFAFEFDDEGFVWRGHRRSYAAIRQIDRSSWQKKGILRVDGIVLDSWHHVGVKEFEQKLRDAEAKKAAS
ncbi:MAG: hypothetical protein ACI4RD_07270 [Kiritimatiellia bacterium]